MGTPPYGIVSCTLMDRALLVGPIVRGCLERVSAQARRI